MTNNRLALLLMSASLAPVLLGAPAASAQGTSSPAPAAATADKSAFHLFNPTPRESMRDLSADRPDTTESPYTVDAGHVQVELSFLDYARDDEGPGDTEVFTLLPTNLKLGLLNNVDLQLVLEPYVRIETDGDADDATGTEADADGFGQTTLRLKLNLWGNDAGRTAFAVMPYLTFPTADDDLDAPNRVEGGLIFPFAIELTDRLGLGLMAEFDFVRDDDHNDYDVEFLHTAVLGFDLSERWGTYLEYIGIEPFEGDADYQALLSSGVTYAATDDVQLDAGLAVGLTDAAEDLRLFAGMTFRL